MPCYAGKYWRSMALFLTPLRVIQLTNLASDTNATSYLKSFLLYSEFSPHGFDLTYLLADNQIQIQRTIDL